MLGGENALLLLILSERDLRWAVLLEVDEEASTCLVAMRSSRPGAAASKSGEAMITDWTGGACYAAELFCVSGLYGQRCKVLAQLKFFPGTVYGV